MQELNESQQATDAQEYTHLHDSIVRFLTLPASLGPSELSMETQELQVTLERAIRSAISPYLSAQAREVPKKTLEEYFTGTSKVYTDEDCKQIAVHLETSGRSDWARVPRIY